MLKRFFEIFRNRLPRLGDQSYGIRKREIRLLRAIKRQRRRFVSSALYVGPGIILRGAISTPAWTEFTIHLLSRTALMHFRESDFLLGRPLETKLIGKGFRGVKTFPPPSPIAFPVLLFHFCSSEMIIRRFSLSRGTHHSCAPDRLPFSTALVCLRLPF